MLNMTTYCEFHRVPDDIANPCKQRHVYSKEYEYILLMGQLVMGQY